MTDEELRSTLQTVHGRLIRAAALVERCIKDGDLDVMAVEAAIAAPLRILIDETDSTVDDTDRSILKLILDELFAGDAHG
nr:hypothetical protein [Methylobacterium sp. ZNC0032]